MSRQHIDISRTIAPGVLVYPGDPPVSIQPFCRIGPGSPFNILTLSWTTHVLTHIDAPRHFLQNGAAVDEIPPERFMGRAIVTEVNGPAVLSRHVPAGVDLRGLNVLFKTRNSERWDPQVYDKNHVYVSAEAAETMADHGANLVGIDYLSIDRCSDETYPAHRILLGRNVLILEGIDLAKVEPGFYTLMALPLKIAGGDGSPVRAVLIPE